MPKKKKLKINEGPKVEIDATCGSPLWAYNHYRKAILTQLLNDLIILENDGLLEQHCKIVRESLEQFVNASTEIPSGGFLTGSLYKEVQKFANVYRDWNDVKGKDEHAIKQRRELLIHLRERRQKITDKVRNLQVELFNSLDRTVLISTYRSVGTLIETVPSLFKNLSIAYADYLKRGPLN
jgi:hypothetical protein